MALLSFSYISTNLDRYVKEEWGNDVIFIPFFIYLSDEKYFIIWNFDHFNTWDNLWVLA